MPERNEGAVPPQEHKEEKLHPVTENLIKETEKGEVKRDERDGFYSDTVWKLLKGEEVKVTYNEHYGVYITIKPDGSGVIQDNSHDNTFEFTNWDLSKYGKHGDSEYVMKIKKALDFIQRVANKIPSGNLERMGGIKGLVNSFLDVEWAEEHAKPLDDQIIEGEDWNNIPTPEVMARMKSE